jgi:hypothetical protein
MQAAGAIEKNVFHSELTRARCCDHRALNNAGKRRQTQLPACKYIHLATVMALTCHRQLQLSATRAAATLTPSLCRSTAWLVSAASACASVRSSTPSSLACGDHERHLVHLSNGRWHPRAARCRLALRRRRGGRQIRLIRCWRKPR